MLRTYLENFWQKEFPGKVRHFDLVIRSDETLEISVYLEKMDRNEHKVFLEKSETGLAKLLSKVFDYNRKFYVTLNL